MQDERVGWHHRLNDISLSELQETVKDREAWRAAAHGVRHDLATECNTDAKRYRRKQMHRLQLHKQVLLKAHKGRATVEGLLQEKHRSYSDSHFLFISQFRKQFQYLHTCSVLFNCVISPSKKMSINNLVDMGSRRKCWGS